VEDDHAYDENDPEQDKYSAPRKKGEYEKSNKGRAEYGEGCSRFVNRYCLAPKPLLKVLGYHGYDRREVHTRSYAEQKAKRIEEIEMFHHWEDEVDNHGNEE